MNAENNVYVNTQDLYSWENQWMHKKKTNTIIKQKLH